jgi:hypothetical protein
MLAAVRNADRQVRGNPEPVSVRLQERLRKNSEVKGWRV